MKKVIKGWAVVSSEEPSMNWHECRPMIYYSRAEAVFNKYKDHKVVPVTVFYTLPKKK